MSRRFPYAVLIVLAILPGCGTSGDRLEAYNAFAIEAAQIGLWHEAAFRWEQALALNEDDARIWNNLGVAYETEERFDDAIAAYKEALRRDPGNTRYLRNLRRCERHIERVAAARVGDTLPEESPSPDAAPSPEAPPPDDPTETTE